MCLAVGGTFCFVTLFPWGLAEPGFVPGRRAPNPAFSLNTAEQVGMRVGVPVQLSSSFLLLCVFWICKLSTYIYFF